MRKILATLLLMLCGSVALGHWLEFPAGECGVWHVVGRVPNFANILISEFKFLLSVEDIYVSYRTPRKYICPLLDDVCEYGLIGSHNVKTHRNVRSRHDHSRATISLRRVKDAVMVDVPYLGVYRLNDMMRWSLPGVLDFDLDLEMILRNSGNAALGNAEIGAQLMFGRLVGATRQTVGGPPESQSGKEQKSSECCYRVRYKLVHPIFIWLVIAALGICGMNLTRGRAYESSGSRRLVWNVLCIATWGATMYLLFFNYGVYSIWGLI